MRVVIDGTVGAGKTTVLMGKSQRDRLNRRFSGFKDMGYPVFSDLVIDVIKEMRMQGIEDPSNNWEMFFSIATQHAIHYYEAADPHTINFYDRGIFYLEIMANRYGYRMPKVYYDFCFQHRYDMPIFIFCPIWGIDMTKPHEEDNRQKVYSVQERALQHKQVIDIYKSHSYDIIEVPLGSENVYESVAYRIDFIKKRLGL